MRGSYRGFRRPVCETGWHKYGESRCIIIPNQVATNFEAHSQCAEYVGRLVTIKNRREANILLALLKSVPVPLDIYIGLHFTGERFEWDDQTPTDNLTNWATGQPNNNSLDIDPKQIADLTEEQLKNINRDVFCVALYRNGTDLGKWNDVSCSLKLAFICEKDIESMQVPSHGGRNAVFGNLILTISLILVILFIVLVLLGLLFLFMLQHRRRLAKAQEAQYMQAQFRNMNGALNLGSTSGPPVGRQIPKIPPEELDHLSSIEYEPPRYEMNFLPATRHQASQLEDKEMIYETILEEDDEERLLRQMRLSSNQTSLTSTTNANQSNRLEIPEYLEIRPSTPDRKYANLYANR